MAKSPELFELIRTLSRQEKRFFKLYYTRASDEEGAETNYLQLFDDINQYKGNDEAEFRAQHEGRPYLDNFSYNKTFLMSKIVTACLSMPNKSIDHQLSRLIAEARFYRDRRIPGASIKKLNKAQQMAEKYEKHEMLLEILRMKRTHYMDGQTHNGQLAMLAINETVRIGNIIQNKYIYLQTKDMLFLAQKNKSRERIPERLKELKRQMDEAGMSEEKALSFDAKHSYYYANALYFQLAGDWDKCLAYHTQIFNLWIKNPDIRFDRATNFRSMVTNYLNLCCSRNRYEHFDEALAYLENPEFHSETERIESLQNSIFIRLTHEIANCQWDRVAITVAKYQANKTAIEKKIHTSRKMAFYIHFAWYELVYQHYKAADDWIEEIFKCGKTNVRDDIKNFAYLFKLLIRIEQDDYDLLEHDIRAASRHFGSLKSLLPYEKVVLHFFNQYIKLDHEEKRRELAKMQIPVLEALAESKDSQNALGLEILIRWLESRVRQIDLRAIVEEKWLNETAASID